MGKTNAESIKFGFLPWKANITVFVLFVRLNRNGFCSRSFMDYNGYRNIAEDFMQASFQVNFYFGTKIKQKVVFNALRYRVYP